MLQTIKQNWFSNVRGDVLSGLVVALALIPEVVKARGLGCLDLTGGAPELHPGFRDHPLSQP